LELRIAQKSPEPPVPSNEENVAFLSDNMKQMKLILNSWIEQNQGHYFNA